MVSDRRIWSLGAGEQAMESAFDRSFCVGASISATPQPLTGQLEQIRAFQHLLLTYVAAQGPLGTEWTTFRCRMVASCDSDDCCEYGTGPPGIADSTSHNSRTVIPMTAGAPEGQERLWMGTPWAASFSHHLHPFAPCRPPHRRQQGLACRRDETKAVPRLQLAVLVASLGGMGHQAKPTVAWSGLTLWTPLPPRAEHGTR